MKSNTTSQQKDIRVTDLTEKSVENALVDIYKSEIMSITPSNMIIPPGIAEYIMENNIDVLAIVNNAKKEYGEAKGL